jgi:hypothetical protein
VTSNARIILNGTPFRFTVSPILTVVQILIGSFAGGQCVLFFANFSFSYEPLKWRRSPRFCYTRWTPEVAKKRSVSRWARKNNSLMNSLCNLPDVLEISVIKETAFTSHMCDEKNWKKKLTSFLSLPVILGRKRFSGLVATIFFFIMNRENELGLQDHNTVLNSLYGWVKSWNGSRVVGRQEWIYSYQ